MMNDTGHGSVAGAASQSQAGVFWMGGDPRWQPRSDSRR